MQYALDRFGPVPVPLPRPRATRFPRTCAEEARFPIRTRNRNFLLLLLGTYVGMCLSYLHDVLYFSMSDG